MSKKLFLVFWWHMHQPLYKDPISDKYILPWTILHAIKDYYSMPNRARMYDVKVNFNLTPVLIEQIQDYERKDVKCLLLENLLQADNQNFWRRLINLMPYQLSTRVEGLSDIKQQIERNENILKTTRKISALYFLSWFPEYKGKILEIRYRAEQTELSEIDVLEMVDHARAIIRKIIKEYIKINDEKKGNISVSPYYHPIIPLLIDFKSAGEVIPDINLPSEDYSLKDDAQDHIRMAVEKYESIFGQKPDFMWPSEGAVSMESIDLISNYGFRLIGTDEDVLFNSLGIRNKNLIYKKYQMGRTVIIFRDKELSDLIGFSYQHFRPKDAVNDFISRLWRIYENSEKSPIVSVILDGENCWEYYPNNGDEFIENLYVELERNKSWIETLSLEDLLQRDDLPPSDLSYLKAGSWIYGNLLKWIGHPEKNRFWQELIETKKSVSEIKDKKNLLVAEGSDWFWWQGESHQPEFDRLFKSNLKRFSEVNPQI